MCCNHSLEDLIFAGIEESYQVSGEIVVDSTMRGLPSGSCLYVYVHEDIQCEDPSACENPILGDATIRDPQLTSSRSIQYSVTFKSRSNKQYVVIATLNMGWCKTDSEWIREGDYKNDVYTMFSIQDGETTASKDISITQYKVDGNSVNESGKDDDLKGITTCCASSKHTVLIDLCRFFTSN